MKEPEANLLLSSFLSRLITLPGGAMELPGGRISAHEAAAFRFFVSNDVFEPVSIMPGSDGAPSRVLPEPKEDPIPLNRVAFSRHGPDKAELRLCLDFGTAMSKAWATGRDETETLTLVLGTNTAGDRVLAVESAIFIDDTGRIFIGGAAERNFRPFVGANRRLYGNIKRLLSDAEPESDLFTRPLAPEIDPTSSGLSSGDLLVLYLAWLTDRSLEALADAVKLVASKLDLTPGSDLRAVARRFAIPCFEDTHNDGRGRKRAQWVRTVMRDYLLRAQILADTLSGRWDGLTVQQLAPLMRELRSENVAPLERLFAADADVREPVAAGASRFASRLLPYNGSGLSRHALLVVDAGAGTTDFAMFQVAAGGERRPRYALMRIPTHPGHLFQLDGGHRSDLMAATIPN